MDAYLLHCLNHVSKTADRIKRNNTRLEAASKQQQAEGQAGTASVEDLPRDQVGCIPHLMHHLSLSVLPLSLPFLFVGIHTAIVPHLSAHSSSPRLPSPTPLSQEFTQP